MEHRARSALRRFAALTLAAGLVALAVLVAPTTAGDAYLPPYFGAPSGTGIYLFRPGEAEDESSFKVLIYDEPSSIGNGQALCASVPQAGNRFAKGGVVRVRWDTSIGFLDMTCKRLTFFQTPRCRGRPYLALMRPDKRGGRMSDDEMQAMLTRRVLPPAQVPKSVKCEFGCDAKCGKVAVCLKRNGKPQCVCPGDGIYNAADKTCKAAATKGLMG